MRVPRLLVFEKIRVSSLSAKGISEAILVLNYFVFSIATDFFRLSKAVDASSQKLVLEALTD